MKKAFHIILIYLLVCVFGTVALAALFMFNQDLMSYVADVPSKLFSLDSFLLGICVSFPFAASLSLVAVIFHTIKNPKNQIAGLAAYIVLGALTWLVLIPVSVKNFSSFESSEPSGIQLQAGKTSSGLFRKDEGGVFYYSRILDDGNADGIFIDTSDYIGGKQKITSFYDSPVNNEPAYPFSDILIKDSLQPPKHVTYPLEIYTSLLTAAENSEKSGFLGWLFFASFALALLSAYGTQFFSGWRICSALYVLIISAFVVFVNYFYYMGFLPSFLAQFDALFKKTFSVDNAFIVFANLLISAVLILLGIFTGIYRKKKSEALGNGGN